MRTLAARNRDAAARGADRFPGQREARLDHEIRVHAAHHNDGLWWRHRRGTARGSRGAAAQRTGVQPRRRVHPQGRRREQRTERRARFIRAELALRARVVPIVWLLSVPTPPCAGLRRPCAGCSRNELLGLHRGAWRQAHAFRPAARREQASHLAGACVRCGRPAARCSARRIGARVVRAALLLRRLASVAAAWAAGARWCARLPQRVASAGCALCAHARQRSRRAPRRARAWPCACERATRTRRRCCYARFGAAPRALRLVPCGALTQPPRRRLLVAPAQRRLHRVSAAGHPPVRVRRVHSGGEHRDPRHRRARRAGRRAGRGNNRRLTSVPLLAP